VERSEMKIVNFLRRTWKENRPSFILEIVIAFCAGVTGSLSGGGIKSALVAVAVFLGFNVFLVILGMIIASAHEIAVDHIQGPYRKK
jgi:hypothetical protein